MRRIAYASATFIVIVAISFPAHSATIEDRAEPALIQGPDVRLIRYADAPGDPEPLYTRVVDGRETGFVRDGGQCMDGKFGGAVMACDVSVADDIANSVLAAVSYALVTHQPGEVLASSTQAHFPDWAGTPLPIVTGDDGSITVIVPPAPLPPVPTAPVPIPGAAVMLLGALATLWMFRK